MSTEITPPSVGQIWNIMSKRRPGRIHCPVKVVRIERGYVYAVTLKKGMEMKSTVDQWNEWTSTKSHILETKMKTYIFYRSDMFYPIELESDESARANAEINPGTTRVEDAETRAVIWETP